MNIEEHIKLINESGGIRPVSLVGLREAMRRVAMSLDEDATKMALRKGAIEIKERLIQFTGKPPA
jgi:hypothetical protein